MENVSDDINDLFEILHLLKRRDLAAVNSPEGKEVLFRSNELLKRGLLCDILGSLKDNVSLFCKGSNDQPNTKASLLPSMRAKADIVFFAAYQTQFEEKETNALQDTISFISDTVLRGPQQSQVNNSTDWCPAIYSLLVVLQLAHVAALQQTACLLSRHVDYSQPLYQQCKSAEDVIVMGNNLPQIPGSRHGMDSSSRGEWLCSGAKGFACLALAVFKQPEVDIDHAPASDVEWFLHEACRLRAYSYIRLCLVPVLQAAYLENKETALFYVAVLCELMENLAKIFCMTHYKQVHAHNENDFPYVFFPPTGEFYAENMAFYSNRLATTHGQQMAPTVAVDSLEDVMSVYTALLELRPEFAHTFWPSTQSHDIEVQQRAAQQQAQMQQTQQTDHHDIVDHYYHPFVMKAVDASFHHPELMICAIRFVAALASSPLGRTAYAGYLFVRDSTHHRFSWDHFFEGMGIIAQQLGASLSSTASNGSTSYSASLAAFGAQQHHPSQHHQLALHNQSLAEKDAEGLLAIVRLIAAVAVHPSAASLLHENFRPIPRLFALLSCALPITLKGAILKTLSVFARGSRTVSEEIWLLVEAHRMLPITPGSFTSPSVELVYHTQHHECWCNIPGKANGKGLRVELEEAESRSGRYPVTEGFLHLLDALLSHGSPDATLGMGYRRPGLMVYLDYVIEDVLLKTQDRPYLPVDWSSARAQRWRITALCLSVLRTVLQNYHINALPAGDVVSNEEFLKRNVADDLSTLRTIVSDFRDQSEDYSVDGSPAPQRLSKPKSAGFVVMSLLLGRARLFDYLGFLLLECSEQNIERSFNDHCLSEVGAAVDLLQRQYELAHPRSTQKHTATFDFAFPHSTVKASVQSNEGEMEVLDLTSLGRETHLCDPVFWQERTVAGTVGLLYECSLRAEKFMSLFRSAPTRLTITRLSDQGRVSVLPVIVHDLSDLLCVDRESGMLALIAQVVPTHVKSCPCLPAVNVLCVRILEHVALHLPAARLMAALIPSAQQLPRPAPSDIPSAGPSWYLMHGCAAALKADVNIAEEQNDGSLHYDVLCLGGAAYPSFFSLSAAYTENVNPPNLYLTMINADSTEEAAQVDAEYLRALRLGGTIREAVLSLLLRTLIPGGSCLSHQLLGLSPSGTSPTALMSQGCLDAVLHVLSPANVPLGTTFIQMCPEQASDCFELIYRLCASPATSTATLRRLGDKQVDFLRVQLTLLVYLMHLSDEELVEGADLSASTFRSGSTGANAPSINPAYAVLQTIKSSLSSCSAWLLKTCSLYMRFSELHRSSVVTTYAQSVLELLFSGCEALPFGAERGDNISVAEKLLEVSIAFPVNASASYLRNASPALSRCMESCTTNQRPSQAGSGWGDNNQFLRQDSAHSVALTYRTIDLRALGNKIRTVESNLDAADLLDALNSALVQNIHAKSAAAKAHFCLAWCQLMNMITAGGKTLQLLLRALGGAGCDVASIAASRVVVADRFSLTEPTGTTGADGDTAAQRRLVDLVFEQLFIPTAGAMSAGAGLDPELSRALNEHLARCLLAQIKTMYSSKVVTVGFIVQPDQHARVLDTTVQLLLQPPKEMFQSQQWNLDRGGTGTLRDCGSSSAYRGMLAAALAQILQASFQAIAAVDVDISHEQLNTVQWSQENKSQQESEYFCEARVLIGECVKINKNVLIQRASDIADALGRDCALKGGAVLWTLSSMGALTAALSCLAGQSETHESIRSTDCQGSHAFVQAVQSLLSRGHLLSIIEAALNPNPNSLSNSSSAAASSDQEALLLSALSLCTQIAGSVEGGEALMETEILDKIIALNMFVNPPPFPDEIAYFGSEALQSRALAVEQLQTRYIAVINLIRSLLAAAPSSQVMARKTAEFLLKNQVLVSQLLRMRYLTLGGLAMTEATTAVFAMVAAVAGSPLAAQKNDVFAALGSSADSFVSDICTLLRVLGQSPVPSNLSAMSAQGGASFSTTSSTSVENWWSRIEPSGGPDSDSYEADWHRTMCEGASGEGMPADWSLFDKKKLRLSLQVLLHCSSFCRLITCAPGGSGSNCMMHGARSISADALCEAFCLCATLSQQLLHGASGNSALHNDSSSESVLNTAARLFGSPVGFAGRGLKQGAETGAVDEGQMWPEGSGRREVLDALLKVSENLICAVHSCALNTDSSNSSNNSNSGDVVSLSAQGARRVLEVAEAFPSHSFIRQVARWVRDQMLIR